MRGMLLMHLLFHCLNDKAATDLVSTENIKINQGNEHCPCSRHTAGVDVDRLQ